MTDGWVSEVTVTVCILGAAAEGREGGRREARGSRREEHEDELRLSRESFDTRLWISVELYISGQRQCQYRRGDGDRGCEDLKAFSLEERLGSAVIGFKDVKDLDSSMAIGNVSSWVLAQKFCLGI